MSIEEQVHGASSPVDRHRDTVLQAITKAETNIAEALTAETYAALSSLKSTSSTHGEYLQAISDLKAANKNISRKDIDDGIKSATANAAIDFAPSELRDGVEPWPDEVSGEELHRDICKLLSLHCVLPDGGAAAIASWVMGSYAIDSFRIFPKLLIHSPQKRCGKTTLLEVLDGLLPRTLTGSNVTPSVIFRAIELWRVSILLDEVDTFLHNSDELRGIVNSGHTRNSAFVWRTEGEAVKEPVQFSTWAPMVIAMIGNPPSTILDRSIKIGLRRKTVNDTVIRIPQSFKEDNLETRRKLARWAQENGDAIRLCQPSMPPHSNDRAIDNWMALFAVSELVDAVPEISRSMNLLAVDDDDADDLSIELLRDIQSLIETSRFTGPTYSSQLTEYLIEMTDRPWPECNRGKPLTANKLAYLLRPYKIKAKNIRMGISVRKGFEPEDFADALHRYISATPLQPHNHAGLSVAELKPVAEQLSVSATDQANVAQQLSNVAELKNRHATLKPTSDAVSDKCSGVAEKSGGSHTAATAQELVL